MPSTRVLSPSQASVTATHRSNNGLLRSTSAYMRSELITLTLFGGRTAALVQVCAGPAGSQAVGARRLGHGLMLLHRVVGLLSHSAPGRPALITSVLHVG